MGLIMEINGDEYEAERYYLKSCKNDFTKAQYRLAYLYDRQDKREDAIEFYEKGIEHNFSLSNYCFSIYRLSLYVLCFTSEKPML